MTSLTTIICCTVLLSATTTLSSSVTTRCEGSSHHLIVGNRTKGDLLLLNDHITSRWKLFRVKKTVVYPTLKNDSSKYTITSVNVTDLYTNGYGGCPEIIAGGVGQDNVTISIKGGYFRGVDFLVEIYGLIKKT